MNKLWVDMETTNTNPQTGSILQIYMEVEVDGKVVSTFNRRIKHDNCNIDLGALKVNKIKMNEIDSLGLPEDKVVKDLVDFLLENQYPNIVLAGTNVHFDRQFLTSLLEKHNVTNIGAILPYRLLDTATISLFLKEAGLINLEKFGSENVYKSLGIPFDKSELHEASKDIELTSLAYKAMLDKVKSLPHRFDGILKYKQEFQDQLQQLTSEDSKAKGQFEKIYQSLFSGYTE